MEARVRELQADLEAEQNRSSAAGFFFLQYLPILVIYIEDFSNFLLKDQKQGRGSRQAEKARREAEVEVEAANRKIEALEVSFATHYHLLPYLWFSALELLS